MDIPYFGMLLLNHLLYLLFTNLHDCKPHVTSTTIPPPASALQFVSVDSLEAALAKMDIKVSVKYIIQVIREVEEAKRAELIAQAIDSDSERFATVTPPNRRSPTTTATTARLLSFSTRQICQSLFILRSSHPVGSSHQLNRPFCPQSSKDRAG